MPENDQVSEFGGESGPTGIHLKPAEALDAAERLRLGYTVGREDPTEAADRAAWLGNTKGTGKA